jgi:hypothetical protein
MTTQDFILTLFCQVDDQMAELNLGTRASGPHQKQVRGRRTQGKPKNSYGDVLGRHGGAGEEFLKLFATHVHTLLPVQ